MHKNKNLRVQEELEHIDYLIGVCLEALSQKDQPEVIAAAQSNLKDLQRKKKELIDSIN